MIFKLLFKLGQKKRNPSITSWYQFLKKSEKWSMKQLEEYQLYRLKHILEVSQLSEFYKEKYQDIDLENIKTLEDLKKLPILTKKDVLTYTKQIHTNKEFKKTLKATTSGSSGESLEFRRDESADSYNRASIFRGYSWYDMEPWNRNGYFWGFNFSKSEIYKTKFLDFLQNRFRVFSYEKLEFEKFVKKLQRAKYIHGYSSMIYQTAKLINQSQLPKPQKLKMVKGTSEKIYDKYHDEVRNAFGLKIISEYGATESGIIAFECPHGHMHINMEGVIVEEVNHEILITNLQLESFPIIRYQLGDYVKLAPNSFSCPCGMKHKVIEEVTGRVGENIYGKHQIYPSLYFYYIFKNLVKEHEIKLNYQVLQKEKGKLEFKIEQLISEEEEQLLNIQIQKYFKKDIEYSIQSNTILEANGKKLKSFISYINE